MSDIIEIGFHYDDPTDLFVGWATSKATREAMRDIMAMDNRPMLGAGKNPMATTGFRRRDHMGQK